MSKVEELLKHPRKYAMERKIGNTTVRIIQPPALTDEQREAILDEFHAAGWAIIEELVEKGEDV